VRTTNIIIKQAKENSNGLLHIDRNQFVQTDTWQVGY